LEAARDATEQLGFRADAGERDADPHGGLVTRPATLSRRGRKVVNSAVASGWGFGIALRIY